MANRRRSADWKPLFLDHFRVTANLSASAKMAGVERSTVYRMMKRSPKFAEAVQEAESEALDLLEMQAWQTAIGSPARDGKAAKPPNERLLMFFLERRRPEKYGRRQDVRISGNPAAPIAVQAQTQESEMLKRLAKHPEGAFLLEQLSEVAARIELEERGVQVAPAIPMNGGGNGHATEH